MADCPRIPAVLVATLLAATGVCRAQEGARFEPALSLQERIVAPSPQVAEMMRYEDAALNSCDGTATMSVPLFQWQAGDIDMSLSLNYRIGSFKTDERGSWLEFVYLADGTKLSMTRSTDIIEKPLPDIVPVDSVIENPLRAGSLSVSFYTTHYVGSYETDGTKFHRLNLPDGYVSVADTVYHWYLTDYQGNISGVVNTTTKELEQYQDYYPYGKPQDTAVDASDNRRKFGGKELITDKGYDAYDFEARPLTLTIPRFTQPDIMAEKFYLISIYVYCSGDPINLRDYHGLSADSVNNALPIENIVWPNIGPVIPVKLFVGWTNEPFYSEFKEQNGRKPNCFDYSKEQLSVAGFNTTGSNDPANLYPYSENTGVNEEQTFQAVNIIEDSLSQEIPLLIGVNSKKGTTNNDGTTDHFLVAVGIGNDNNGNFILVFDNATSSAKFGANKSNKLYFNPITKIFEGVIMLRPDTYKKYQLTQLRPTKRK